MLFEGDSIDSFLLLWLKYPDIEDVLTSVSNSKLHQREVKEGSGENSANTLPAGAERNEHAHASFLLVPQFLHSYTGQGPDYWMLPPTMGWGQFIIKRIPNPPQTHPHDDLIFIIPWDSFPRWHWVMTCWHQNHHTAVWLRLAWRLRVDF